MADLKSLFAKKANPDVGQSGTSNVSPAASVAESKTRDTNPDGTDSIQNATPVVQAPNSGSPDTGKKGFAFRVGNSSGSTPGGNAASSGVDSSSEQPKSGLSSIRLNTGTSDSGNDPGGLAEPSIDSLDALNVSEDAGSQPVARPSVSYFADETPATKPTRELPEGVTKEQLGFIETVDSVYEIIHDPDMLGGVISNIMVELKSNPEYTKLMQPDDIRVMVRGMRESMGLARVKKQESKAKRTGGSKKSKALDDDVLAGLDDIMGDIS